MNRINETSINNAMQLPITMDRTPDLLSRIKSLPKIDLHRHLTGSMRTETVMSLGKKNSVPLPTNDLDELEKYITCLDSSKNFKEFITLWTNIKKFNLNSIICEEIDFYRLTYEAIEDAYKDNIKYLELRTSPYGITNGSHFCFPEVLESINSAINHADRDFGVITKLILSIPRHVIGWRIIKGEHDYYNTYFNELLETALDYKDKPVVGFDLSGQYERRYPPKLFRDFFTEAKNVGFKVSIHAGETGGPESILDAINILHADRIGHGINADDRTQDILKERSIPLEICPTSNIRTGVVESWAKCRIKELYNNGVIITVNTDNPRVFKTTLTDEYYYLIVKQDFKLEDIRKIILNGIDAAFIPRNDKINFKNSFIKEFGGNEDGRAI